LDRVYRPLDERFWALWRRAGGDLADACLEPMPNSWWEGNDPGKIEPLSSKIYFEWPLKKIADAGVTDTSRVFVSAELVGADTTISSNIAYLAPTKEIHLKPASLRAQVSSTKPLPWEKLKGKSKFNIRITSPVLARDVYLSFGDLDVKLSDNYFDLLPGETIEVSATSAASLSALKAQLKAISLVDAFAAGGRSASVKAVR